MSPNEPIDLGHGHTIQFIAWKPDRGLPENAERYRDMPDNPRCGAVVKHPSPDGECARVGSYIGLDPNMNTSDATWQILQDEPLTLAPSLLCMRCGDHGWIRDGRWVPA